MTATALFKSRSPAASLPGLLDDLRAAWHTFRRRRADRASPSERAPASGHVLADMGIAAIVPTPAVGGWGRAQANGFLVRSR